MVKPFLFGLTIGGIGTLLAMQYHLVRTDERFLIVSRAHQPPIRSVYVDIRNWNEATWKSYPELQEAVIKAGREDLLTAQKKAEKVPEKAIVSGDSGPQMREVSTAGPTPILTAADLRQTLPGNAPQTFGSRPATPQTASPESSGSDWANSPISYKSHGDQHNFPTMQKTVPNPVEMESRRTVPQQNAESDSQGEKASRPSWVLNLIRNMNPLDTSTGDAQQEPQQAPQPAVSGPVPSQASPTPARASEVMPAEIQPYQAPTREAAPVQPESTFPSSPRRIPVATWQLN